MRRKVFSFSRLLKKFLTNRAGGVAIFAGITLPIVFLAAGVSIDYARAYFDRVKLHATLDAAVLAGVGSSQDHDQQIEAAKSYFAGIEDMKGITAHFVHEGQQLRGTASADIDTTLLNIFQVESLNVAAQSAASAEAMLGPMCFMAMHPTRKHTLELKGSVSVIAPDCHIYGNSNHPYDVVDPHKPENFLIGKSVQAIGYGHHYLENVIPPLEYAPYLIPDPLAAMKIPTANCDDDDDDDNDNAKVIGGTATLNPGKYCKGLEIKSGADVKLNPGTYIISGQKFKVFDSKLSGEGVTIVLANDKTEIQWKDAEIRLSAPKSGPYTSMAMMGVREYTKHSMKDSIVDIHGIVYIPMGEFKWVNKGSPAIDSKWTVWIIDGVTWKGEGKIFINFKPDESDIPYPNDLRYLIPRPGTPRLVN